MRSFLIRCYPARWRARYGNEFEALLEERPLGPFDVADILLGALDAQLRFRGHGADARHPRRLTMSLRIGGIAAIIGAALFATSIVLGIGSLGDFDPVAPAILLLSGSVVLLVALAGLSAFQARVHPILSWAAFAVTAIGMLAGIVGVIGMQVVGDGYWTPFILGILGALVGSTLFAIATFRTAALSRRAALLLGVSSVATIVSGLGGNTFGPIPLIVTSIGFALAWLALGVYAVRLDRPASPIATRVNTAGTPGVAGGAR
jgi:hypothetical protein